MKTRLSLFLTAMVLAALSLALPAVAEIEKAESSVPAAPNYDPYAPDGRMPGGPFRGHLMDISEKRPLVTLPPAEAAKYSPAEGDVVVANFFHEGKFWIAKIPTHQVEKMYFIPEPFKAVLPAAHNLLRYQLKPGAHVELFPQSGAEPPRKRLLDDIFVSSEAVLLPGDRFDLVNGLADSYGKVIRFMSADEIAFNAVYSYKNDPQQIEIVWPKKDGKGRRIISEVANGNSLRDAIQASDREGLSRMYNTVLDSCATDAYGFIDRAVVMNGRQRLFSGLRTLPFLSRTYLWLRGLIPFSALLKNPTRSFREEFPHLLDLPDFRARLVAKNKQKRRARVAFLRSGVASKRGGIPTKLVDCVDSLGKMIWSNAASSLIR